MSVTKMSQIFIPSSLRALFGLRVLRLVSARLLLLLLLLGAVAEALKSRQNLRNWTTSVPTQNLMS